MNWININCVLVLSLRISDLLISKEIIQYLQKLNTYNDQGVVEDENREWRGDLSDSKLRHKLDMSIYLRIFFEEAGRRGGMEAWKVKNEKRKTKSECND